MSELAADLALALGVLFLIGMAFMAWQAWLIARQGDATQSLVQVRTQAVLRVNAAIETQRRQLDQALGDTVLRTAMAGNDVSGREAAALRTHTLLPDARAVVFYSPG
ncbi:MAG: hypothetical protein ACREP1_05140, partial [Rhodanobacteraceae bacterium]